MQTLRRHALRYTSFLWIILVFTCTVCAQQKFLGSIWKYQTGAEECDPLFGSLFDQVTPENAGKWGKTEGAEDSYAWDALDGMYAAADSFSLNTKQHTFVWGMQQPDWVTSANAQAAVEDWISDYMARYGDKVDMIDVVNEPIHQKPSYRSGLGGDGATGWDWVVWVFKKARQYAPDAQLLINEFDVLKSDNILSQYMAIIRILKDSSLVDGIGVQGHFLESTPASEINRRLDSLATLGLPVYVSEYDVNKADDTGHKNTFEAQFRVFWEHQSVQGVTFWGHHEGQMWRDNAFLVRSDGSERSALTWLREYLGRTQPTRPTGLTATPVSVSEVTLSWQDNSSNESGFGVERRIDNGNWQQIAQAGADETAHTDASAADAALYAYRVRALSTDGYSLYTTIATFDTRAPVIVSHPRDACALAGQNVIFTVDAAGRGGTLIHRWQEHDGTGWSDAGTGSSYAFAAAPSQHGNRFRCIVEEGSASTISNSAGLQVFDPSGVFIESGGRAVMEAEHFGRNEQNGDVVAWQKLSDGSASNGEYMTTEAAGDALWETSCELSYALEIGTPGAYSIAVRRIASSGQNSAMWGIDGRSISRNDFKDNAAEWTWVTSGSTVELDAGLHVLSIRRREDQWKVDKIIMAIDAGDLPAGTAAGPSESARGAEVEVMPQQRQLLGALQYMAVVAIPGKTGIRMHSASPVVKIVITNSKGAVVCRLHESKDRNSWQPHYAARFATGVYIIRATTVRGNQMIKAAVIQ
ncbi:MAG: hypothetical protein GF350_11875 [Chitinivibrionales bacterium]|nr:hypothetical protein [Chitinivibrionales bacterium]